MQKGKLIVMEGLDGSGKATQTRILTNALTKRKKEVCKISFPDYSQASSALAKMYLNSEFGPSPDIVNAYAASSFFSVDRYASYMRFWKKDYELGKTIIADRYTTSNMVYHLGKFKKSEWNKFISWLEDYEYVKLGIPAPDLTIYLDMPVEVSQKFMTKRYHGEEAKKDLHEKNVEFLKKSRESALYAAERLGWRVVECSRNSEPKTIDEIHELVMKEVEGEIF